MNYITAGLGKYSVTMGRARRAEFWVFGIVCCIVNNIISRVAAKLSVSLDTVAPLVIIAVAGLVSAAVCIPWMAVAVRRLHDVGKSALWLLVGFAFAVGVFVGAATGVSEVSLTAAIGSFIIGLCLLCLFIRKGQDGENQFGGDPLKVDEATIVHANSSTEKIVCGLCFALSILVSIGGVFMAVRAAVIASRMSASA